MDIKEIAAGLVALCREGKFGEAVEKYYGDDIVSVEAMGEDRETHGLDAVKAKNAWFMAHHEIHGATMEDPFFNGDQFAVKTAIDVTYKDTNQRQLLTEISVYTVKNGKIVHETFFM